MKDERRNSLCAAMAMSNMGHPLPAYNRDFGSVSDAVYSMGRHLMEEEGWEDALLEEAENWDNVLRDMTDEQILRIWPDTKSYFEDSDHGA